MKIFVSQSGDLSRLFAKQLKQWIVEVIPTIENLWISSEDITAGERWIQHIDEALKDAHFGILCITKDNIQSPWIHFEAGALSREKHMKVCPVLLDCDLTDLPSNLTQFQSIKADKDGIWFLVKAINDSLGNNSLKSDRLTSQFERSWVYFGDFLRELSIELSKANMRQSIANDINIITMGDFVERETRLSEGDTVSLFSNTLHYDNLYFKNTIADNLKKGVRYRYLMADDPAIKYHWSRLVRSLSDAGAKKKPEGRFTQIAPLIWTTAIYEYRDTAKGIEAISILEYRFESEACIEVSRPIAEKTAERFAVFWDSAKPELPSNDD